MKSKIILGICLLSISSEVSVFCVILTDAPRIFVKTSLKVAVSFRRTALSLSPHVTAGWVVEAVKCKYLSQCDITNGQKY